MAPFTSFKIGGKAKYFYSLKNKRMLPFLIKWAKKKKLPVFVLGGGSNVLVSDQGYPGLAILMRLSRIKMEKGLVAVDSGVLLSRVLNFCLKNNLSGLEWAVGIPGTIGGAMVNNAGAFGKSIGDFVAKAEVLKIEKFIEMNKKEMEFSYRQSVFKKPGNKYLITRVWLKGFGKATQESEQFVVDYLKKRKDSQPQAPSAGCVFKNFTPHSICGSDGYNKLCAKIGIAKHRLSEGPTQISAGFLIEKCGLKGYQIGGAEISQKHANFIINHNQQAKASDVLGLIKLIKSKVKKKYNVDLKEEIQYVGFVSR